MIGSEEVKSDDEVAEKTAGVGAMADFGLDN